MSYAKKTSLDLSRNLYNNSKKMKKIILSIAFFFCCSLLFAQRIITPMDEGSKVHFVIRNFGIKTGGDFSGLKGTIKFDLTSVSTWVFDVTVESASINTDNDTRDGHLKKAEYFDVKKYPAIHMVSSKILTTEIVGVYQFIGNLTIKAVTKPIQFPFKVNSSNGGYLFTGSFEINRRDFGVGGSSISMSDDLNVSLSVFAK